MNTETREERIKRLMKEREEGTLNEKPASAGMEEKPVEPEPEQDWEEESRIISARNRERIKKNADLAAAQAKAATQFAEKGARSAFKSLQVFKEKTEAKIQAENEKRRLKREEQDTIKSVDMEVLESKSGREPSAGSSSAQRQTRMKFWMLCSISVALSVALTAVWLFKTTNAPERVEPSTAEQVKTDQTATTQVLTPVQAVLPTVEEPPQTLPPLPQESQAEDLGLEVPADVPEKRPETERPVVKSERAQKPVAKKAEPEKSQWQKDAAQKLEEYQF